VIARINATLQSLHLGLDTRGVSDAPSRAEHRDDLLPPPVIHSRQKPGRCVPMISRLVGGGAPVKSLTVLYGVSLPLPQGSEGLLVSAFHAVGPDLRPEDPFLERCPLLLG
jgi:hypothetical protein